MAKDWCYYEHDLPVTHKFSLVEGLIVGLKLSEDEEKIVIAHQYFEEDNKVRHTTVVSKSSILERLDFNFEDGKLWVDEVDVEDLEVD